MENSESARMIDEQFHLIEIDDGHKPGGAKKSTQLALNHKTLVDFVATFDNVLPKIWVDRGYETAVERMKPWGVYITNAEALDPSLDPEDLWSSDPFKAIGLVATRHLIYGRGSGLVAPVLPQVDGTVVWCLTSKTGSSVSYHIDYAELFRYETNIIHPPLVGGVMHLSPFEAGVMQGGDFMINTEGLKHYQRFGYKGKLQGPDALATDLVQNPNWSTIRYKCNRGILFDGDLPHVSTPITSIAAASSSSSASSSSPTSSSSEMARVILGFNCFGSVVGACCRRAPEHSDAFNRTIKMYQSMATLAKLSVTDVGDPTPQEEQEEEEEVEGQESTKPVSLDGAGSGSVDGSQSQSQSQSTRPQKRGAGFTVEQVKSSPFLRKLVLAAAKSRKEQAGHG